MRGAGRREGGEIERVEYEIMYRETKDRVSWGIEMIKRAYRGNIDEVEL